MVAIRENNAFGLAAKPSYCSLIGVISPITIIVTTYRKPIQLHNHTAAESSSGSSKGTWPIQSHVGATLIRGSSDCHIVHGSSERSNRHQPYLLLQLGPQRLVARGLRWTTWLWVLPAWQAWLILRQHQKPESQQPIGADFLAVNVHNAFGFAETLNHCI